MVGRDRKKRGVPSHVKKDVADDENVDEGCPRCAKVYDSHILDSSKPIRCEDCRERRGRDCKGKGADGSIKGIWVCLECGRYVCGGVDKPNASKSHAIRHQRQTHHHVFMQRDNPLSKRWCFGCGIFLPDKETEGTKDVSDQKELPSETEEYISSDEKEQPVEEAEEKEESTDISSEENEPSPSPSPSAARVEETGNAIKSEEEIIPNSLDGNNGYVVRGLINLKNTCYLNSVMQNLLALDKLRDHFLNPLPPTGPLTFSLKNLFAETTLDMDSGTPINPRPLFDNICAKYSRFGKSGQQDSHELLVSLLQELRAEELNVVTGNEDATFVDEVFGGEISSTLTCEVCGHTSTKYEPFLDLSLSVPTKKARAKKTKRPPREVKRKPHGSSGNLKEEELDGIVGDPDPDQVDESDSPVSIKSCLAQFVKPELLSDNNAWNCDKCAENLHKSLISEPPGVSVLQNNTTDSSDGRTSEPNPVEYKCDDASLMESVPSKSCIGNNTSSEIAKNSQSQEIDAKTKATKNVLITKTPPILTIHLKRIHRNVKGRLIKSNDSVVFQEIIDIRQYVQPSCRDGDNHVYHLVGIVEHMGSTMSRGHYVAYVRGREKMKGKSETEHSSSGWYYVTDKCVSPVSLQTVLDQQAYILFYEKK